MKSEYRDRIYNVVEELCDELEGNPELKDSAKQEVLSVIDEIERTIKDALGDLSVSGIGDIGNIETAHSTLDDLADKLW
jgi:hypothetical protein